MRSKVNIKGHPIHPILIAFPIAFFAGTLLFDILGYFGNSQLHFVAKVLCVAGLISAYAAAIPGTIDYFKVIPPESSAKKRGAKHGILNVTVTIFFGFALYIRHFTDAPSPLLVIGLEFIGFTILLFSGWMGGTLVYKNQIGVDNRYANSGKWLEETVELKNGKADVGSSEELKTDQMKLVHVAGKRIVIGKTESEYVAFDDRCNHKGGSLAAGTMICGTVQCPWHGSQFDVKSGAAKAGPSVDKIKTYQVNVVNGRLQLILD